MKLLEKAPYRAAHLATRGMYPRIPSWWYDVAWCQQRVATELLLRVDDL